MFCSDCGAETSDQATFCPVCGHDLRGQRAQRSHPEEAVPSVINAGRSGFWRRFAAHAIDIVVIWFAVQVVWGAALNAVGYGYGYGYRASGLIEGPVALAPYFFFTPSVSQTFMSMETWSDFSYWIAFPATWFYTVIPLAAILAYYVVGTTIWGRTLGKAVLGIRVVGPDGTPPGLVRTIIRETVGKALSGFFWIGFLMAAGKQKRGLHDRISGTEVEVSAPKWQKLGNPAQEEAR